MCLCSFNSNLTWRREFWISKVANVSSVRTTVPQAKLQQLGVHWVQGAEMRPTICDQLIQILGVLQLDNLIHICTSCERWSIHHKLHHHCMLAMHIVQVCPNIPWVPNDSEIRNDHILAGWCKRYTQNCHEMNHVQYDSRKELVLGDSKCCPGHIQDYPSTYQSCAIVTHVLHCRLEVLRPLQTNHAKLAKWLDLPRTQKLQTITTRYNGLHLKNCKVEKTQNNSHNKDCYYCSSTHHVRSLCRMLSTRGRKLPWAEKVSRQGFVAWKEEHVAFDYSKLKRSYTIKRSRAIYASLIPRRICLGFAPGAGVFLNPARKINRVPNRKSVELEGPKV